MTNNLFMDDLIESIRFVYNNSNEYFASTNGRERSIVFRIAHRLANTIEGEGIFVDIEPTRCEDDIKRMLRVKTNNIGAKIVPDLIIHKRKSSGILVAEFKCYYNAEDWQNDFNKLIDLTKGTHSPHYKLGVFVYLTDKLKDVEFRIYENGIDTTQNYLNGVLKGFKYAKI